MAGAARLRHRDTAGAVVATRFARDGDPAGVNWRFRAPEREEIRFTDVHLGPQRMTAGKDFGDFIVWRRDDVPAYQLAVVVDDAAMGITEVVRGADLLKSTARQILLFRALGLVVPDYLHCDLVRDSSGVRLAKRHDSLSIRRLRDGVDTGTGARGVDLFIVDTVPTGGASSRRASLRITGSRPAPTRTKPTLGG